MGGLLHFGQGILLILVICPALLPVRREGSSKVVLYVAASKVVDGEGGFGTRPPPSLVPPSSWSVEGGGDEEEEDDEHTTWLSDLSSTPSMSFPQHSIPSRGSRWIHNEIEEGTKANEDEHYKSEDDVGKEDDDDDSLEALLSAPVLEDRRAQSSWVHRFCSTSGNEFFCAVPASFLADEFNWLGLPSDLAAINLLLGNVVDKGNKRTIKVNKENRLPLVWDEATAQRMYGLIHARFIVTQKGLNAMREKYERGHFGRCPRLACNEQALLPVGIRDEESGKEQGEEDEGHGQRARKGCVNVYCPRCQELYRPADPYHQQLNGAYWGTSFAHLFTLAFPDLRPVPSLREESLIGTGKGDNHSAIGVSSKSSSNIRSSTGEHTYLPRVFGFRVEEEGERDKALRSEYQKGRRAADSTPPPLYPAEQCRPHDRSPSSLSRKRIVIVKTKFCFWEITHLWSWRWWKEIRKMRG
eukprot:evm.model.NODE_5589_length_28864_cov_20.848082.2